MRHHDWKTPIESFNGDKPDVSYFRAFGTCAYVWIPPEQRQDKLSPTVTPKTLSILTSTVVRTAHVTRDVHLYVVLGGTKSSQGRCSQRDTTSLIRLERLGSSVWCFKGHKLNACGLKYTLDCADQE